MGQVGTQFDGFTHQTIGDSLYNCVDQNEVMTRTGFTRLGVENVGTLMTRGVLIDVAALKGVDMLPDTYEITVDDLQQALDRQGVALEPGDAVLIHTGLGRALGHRRGALHGDQPGHRRRGRTVARGAGSPMLLGADNQPVEVSPNPDPEISLPIHQIMLVVNGIHLVERMRLDELAAAGVYEFAFVVQPLKIEGATGSTVVAGRHLLTGSEFERAHDRQRGDGDEPTIGGPQLGGAAFESRQGDLEIEDGEGRRPTGRPPSGCRATGPPDQSGCAPATIARMQDADDNRSRSRRSSSGNRPSALANHTCLPSISAPSHGSRRCRRTGTAQTRRGS